MMVDVGREKSLMGCVLLHMGWREWDGKTGGR
jgi:hypothetical protein